MIQSTEGDYNPAPLVVRFGAFGDTVMLLPLLERLQQRYGNPCELISSGGWTPQVLKDHPAVGKIHLLKSRRTPYWFSKEQQALVQMLCDRQPGPIYLNEFEPKSHSWFRRANVDPGWMVSERDLPNRGTLHRVAIGVELAALTPSNVNPIPDVGETPAFPVLSDDYLQDDIDECRSWLESKGWQDDRLVLIQPGNKRTMRRGRRTRSSNVKHWPESSWAETVQKITAADPDCRVLILGVPAEAELADDIVRLSDRPRVHNVANELPLRRLFGLLKLAHSMVSVDTGPAHAASAAGCPLVVMFQATDPGHTGPLGPKQVEVVERNSGQASILVDDVVDAWKKLD